MASATRIERMEVYSYALTYAHGTYVMSHERKITTLDSTVVVLRTANGTSGYGEVCPLGSAYLPSSAPTARSALCELAEAVVGAEATSPNALYHRMDSCLAGHPFAKSAIDVACYDLFGKLSGMPVGALLGGAHHAEVPLYVAVPLASAEEMVEFVLSERAGGIHTFQLKLGADPDEDAERVRAVVEATGPGDTVVADANGGWRLTEAVQAARAMEKLPRLRLEQPCPTYEECAQVRRRTQLPMILDEVIVDVPALVRAASERVCEGINLKVSRVGGLGPARVVRDLCAALGIALIVEDTWGGDLTTAAVAQLAGSTPTDVLFACSYMNDWTLEHLAGYAPRSRSGRGPVPTGPGLGVAVDEAMLTNLVCEASLAD